MNSVYLRDCAIKNLRKYFVTIKIQFGYTQEVIMKTILPLLLCLLFNNSYADNKHDISIIKFKFSPAEITIEVGDTIRWTNKEKRQYHSVWFKQIGDPEPDYFFPDEFFERTFKEAGDFPYLCGPHPRMKGLVHVIKAKTKLSDKSAEARYLVESVEDGDTLVIQYKGKSQRVQLIGIDAPEDTQNPKLNFDSNKKHIEKSDLLELGKLATEHLKTLVQAGQKVTLQGNLTQKDKYNRLPAIVVNEKGKSLNKRMVEDGYALVLTRFALNGDLISILEKAEKKARSDKLGLWKSHSELMGKWSF